MCKLLPNSCRMKINYFSLSLKAKKGPDPGPVSSRQAARAALAPGGSIFCSTQAFNCLEEARPARGQSALLFTDSVSMASRNTLIDTLRIQTAGSGPCWLYQADI